MKFSFLVGVLVLGVTGVASANFYTSEEGFQAICQRVAEPGCQNRCDVRTSSGEVDVYLTHVLLQRAYPACFPRDLVNRVEAAIEASGVRCYDNTTGSYTAAMEGPEVPGEEVVQIWSLEDERVRRTRPSKSSRSKTPSKSSRSTTPPTSRRSTMSPTKPSNGWSKTPTPTKQWTTSPTMPTTISETSSWLVNRATRWEPVR